MHGKYAVYLVLLFLPVSTGLADIILVQGYGIAANNGVLLVGGPPGVAGNTNVAVVGENQQSINPYTPEKAMQSENAMLIQSASAVGMDGAFGVGQSANVAGGQLQAVGGGQSLQDQFLNAGFAQDVARNGGIGAAVAIQSFVGLDVQINVSHHGANANVNYLGVSQIDTIGGGPG